MAKRGQRFTHKHFIQPDWKPNVEAGEKYRHGPKAEMVVRQVLGSSVIYGYADDAEGGGFLMDRATFDKTYPEEGTDD